MPEECITTVITKFEVIDMSGGAYVSAVSFNRISESDQSDVGN